MDKRYGLGWGIGPLDGGLDEVDGLGEEIGAGGVEGCEGVALLEAVSAAVVEADAGVGIDGRTGGLTARAEALHGPAEGGGVEGGDPAGLRSGESVGCAGVMEGRSAVEDAGVAALRSDHGQEAIER